MYFPRNLVLLLSAPLLALAQQPNPFNIPASGLNATGGQPLTLSWKPTTQGTISLVLRSGTSNDLSEGTVIASKIPNSGSYTWTPKNSLTRGSDYTVEIIDDSDPSLTNYTPPFVLDTTNTVASSTGTVTIGSSSTRSQKSTASTSASSSSSGSSSSSQSGSSSTTGSASAAASSAPPVPSTTSNVGARHTAVAGLLGVVALGAFAL